MFVGAVLGDRGDLGRPKMKRAFLEKFCQVEPGLLGIVWCAVKN